MSALRQYSVYGHCLASTMEFPELPPGDGPARWTFHTSATLPPMREAVLLGSDPLYDEVAARLHLHADGHRVTVDDTGPFDITPDRRTITWGEHAGAWPDFIRAHLTGRVIATALWLDGLLPLHASAVATPDGVIAFLAPKGYGKSTLALALAAAGAPLVSDDTLPVDLSVPAAATSSGDPAAPERAPGSRGDGRPRAWPGVLGLRVHEDALAAVGIAPPSLTTREGKRVVTALPTGRGLSAPAPLAAIYLLAPVPAEVPAVTREMLPAPIAAIATVAHVKAGRMLGASAAPAMLARTAEVVRQVPVHRLYAPRDLARLDETARTLLDWHGAARA